MEGPQKLPEDLLSSLRNFDSLSDEERLKIRQELLERARKLPLPSSLDYWDLVLLLSLVSVVIFIMEFAMADLLDKIKKLSDESNRLSHKINDFSSGNAQEITDYLKNVTISYDDSKYFCAFASALLVFSLVFFGYKLYKSLVERERRKEEKRRQKQNKKKK